MIITFYPDVEKTSIGSGTCSEISWQKLHEHLEKAFELRKNEKLIGIEVTEAGIKGTFRMEKKEE